MLDPDLFPFLNFDCQKMQFHLRRKFIGYIKKKWNEKSDYKSHRATAFINI